MWPMVDPYLDVDPYAWWFRDPAIHQLRLVVYPIIYKVLNTIPGGCFGEFWTRNCIHVWDILLPYTTSALNVGWMLVFFGKEVYKKEKAAFIGKHLCGICYPPQATQERYNISHQTGSKGISSTQKCWLGRNMLVFRSVPYHLTICCPHFSPHIFEHNMTFDIFECICAVDA